MPRFLLFINECGSFQARERWNYFSWRLHAPRQLGSIHRIYLQTPAGMNNLAGYISNHLLPSLALSIFSPVSSSDLLSSLRVVKLAILPSLPFP